MEKENSCRKLYRDTFCDPDTTFEDVLFNTCYKYCKSAEISGKAVSMLFALPCSIEFSGDKKSGTYLYAAATDKQFRNQGLMSKLIEQLKGSSEGIIILRPADDGLINFYKRFGFRTAIATNKVACGVKLIPEDGYKDLVSEIYGESHGDDCAEDFTVMYYSGNEVEIERLYFINSME